MAQGLLESKDFDTYHSLSVKAHRTQMLASNDAFVAAMNKAVRKGREKARSGTFVDLTPTFGKRMYGEAAMSCCGSPAAMCVETAVASAGAETMK